MFMLAICFTRIHQPAVVGEPVSAGPSPNEISGIFSFLHSSFSLSSVLFSSASLATRTLWTIEEVFFLPYSWKWRMQLIHDLDVTQAAVTLHSLTSSFRCLSSPAAALWRRRCTPCRLWLGLPPTDTQPRHTLPYTLQLLKLPYNCRQPAHRHPTDPSQHQRFPPTEICKVVPSYLRSCLQ